MTAPSMSASCGYPSLRDRLILLDGWSKTYAMTGWRLGYGVWPEALIGHAERLAINCHSCVNAAAQYAGIAALTGPREPVRRMVAAFAERREMIVAALNGLPGVRCAQPGGAFYTFPNIAGTGYDARTLQGQLLEEGRGGDDRRHQLWRIWRGVFAVFLRQQPRGDRRGDRREFESFSATRAFDQKLGRFLPRREAIAMRSPRFSGLARRRRALAWVMLWTRRGRCLG